MMDSNKIKEQIKFDTEGLYKEETFTDRKVGSIKKLTPVDSNGDIDNSRDILFIGQSQMMTPMGALPLNFEIDASDLSQALDNFVAAAEVSVNETMEELKRLQREQASSIVLPGQGSNVMPSGSNIQIP